MSPRRFVRYELRTTDPHAAAAFYAEVVGRPFWSDAVICTPLPEVARLRGAPAHWLGHIGPCDVASLSAATVASGGQALGPVRRSPGGPASAALRDPFGAVFAVTDDSTVPTTPVAWHALNVTDSGAALAWYAARFGWTPAGHLEPSPTPGAPTLFTWLDSPSPLDSTSPPPPPTGSIAETARLPGVHPHWLFCFQVPNLAAATAATERLGARMLPPLRTPTGPLVTPGEDPQGAMFALLESPPPP